MFLIEDDLFLCGQHVAEHILGFGGTKIDIVSFRKEKIGGKHVSFCKSGNGGTGLEDKRGTDGVGLGGGNGSSKVGAGSRSG